MVGRVSITDLFQFQGVGEMESISCEGCMFFVARRDHLPIVLMVSIFFEIHYICVMCSNFFVVNVGGRVYLL